MSHQMLTASKILFCRCQDGRLLFEFLKWKTAAGEDELNSWVREVTEWREKAKQDDCELYAAGDNTQTLRRAAALLAKFMAERSLHIWVHQQNVTVGITPATALVVQELSNRGLQGKPREASDTHRKHRSSLQFLRRWRQRWGVRHGKIQIGEQLDSKELLAKACLSSSRWQCDSTDMASSRWGRDSTNVRLPLSSSSSMGVAPFFCTSL